MLVTKNQMELYRLFVVLVSYHLIFSCTSYEVKEKSLDDVSFSSKSAYKFLANYGDLKTSSKPKNCKAIQLNMVFRHGTRYPSAKDIKKFNKVLELLNSRMERNQELTRVIAKINVSLANHYATKDKELTAIGDRELFMLARNFSEKFPELFEEPYSIDDFRFTSTCKSRSSRSVTAFAMGLWEGKGHLGKGKQQPIAVEMSPCDKDSILRYFDMCTKYVKHVSNNDTALHEMNKFLHGPEMQSVVENIQSKLGLINDSEINPKTVQTLYLMCAYDTAIFDTPLDSGWCSLFDKSDFDILEYLLDLKSYYKRSTGYRITYESSCPLLKDVLHSIQARANRDVNYPSLRGIFRSSHAETIIPLYALMDLLVNKEPLKANNYNVMKDRPFKAAKIAPFAGNIGFVLYKCQDSSYKVQVYGNEKLIKLPCCETAVDCLLEVFEECYSKIVHMCDLDKMCAISEKKSHTEL